MKGTMGNPLVSDCHSYPLKADRGLGGPPVCNWCGKDTGSHLRNNDDLLHFIEADLCDWDRPSHLATTDLWETIHKVAVMILKDRESRPCDCECHR